MDVEGSSGQHFPNWNAAIAHYTTHYRRGCVHVLPSFPGRPVTLPPSSPPDIRNHSRRQKKSKAVKSTADVSAPSKRHRRRGSSSSSAGNYRSLYENDDPVRPVIADPAPRLLATPANLARSSSPGAAGNPIEVHSNFPTPVANEQNPKRHRKLKGLGIPSSGPPSPTPPPALLAHLKKTAHLAPALSIVGASSSPPTLAGQTSISNASRPLVYVCDCSDEEGGYSAPRTPSLKRKVNCAMKAKFDSPFKHKATSAPSTSTLNTAASSSSRMVIEILTDSEDDEADVPPLPKHDFCKCFPVMKMSSPAAQPESDADDNSVTNPEIPRPSPPAQV